MQKFCSYLLPGGRPKYLQMFTGHWYITVSYKTVQLQKGTFQNSTLNNDTLQHGMHQNGKALQNGNVFKKR
jgi:hypothetical protein